MPEHDPSVAFEASDASPGAIVCFGLGLGVFVVLALAMLAWLFDAFRSLEQRRDPGLSKLVRQQRPLLPRDLSAIPEPRLQTAEVLDMDQLRQQEEKLLTTFGWVDRDKQLIRLPVASALKLLADPEFAEKQGLKSRGARP